MVGQTVILLTAVLLELQVWRLDGEEASEGRNPPVSEERYGSHSGTSGRDGNGV